MIKTSLPRLQRSFHYRHVKQQSFFQSVPSCRQKHSQASSTPSPTSTKTLTKSQKPSLSEVNKPVTLSELFILFKAFSSYSSIQKSGQSRLSRFQELCDLSNAYVYSIASSVSPTKSKEPHRLKVKDPVSKSRVSKEGPSSTIYKFREFHNISKKYLDNAHSASSSLTTSNTPAETEESSWNKVNGPPTTLPPPLNLPELPPNASPRNPLHLFRIGRAFISFYKTACKNIYYNLKDLRKLRSSLPKELQKSPMKAAIAGKLSRSEFQLWVRTQEDLKRLPLFGLALCVCGEFTPLIVAFLGGEFVPPTAWIPKQVQKKREKMEERRQTLFDKLPAILPHTGYGTVDQLERVHLLHINRSLDLSSSFWDFSGDRWGFRTSTLSKRALERVDYLRLDDSLIKKYGGVHMMEVEEIKRALVERGIDISEIVSEHGLRITLAAWLESRSNIPVTKLLLTRPTHWPHSPQRIHRKRQ